MSEFVEPLGRRLLIRKDESRQKTRGGIVLPDKAEIPTITGRIVEVSAQIDRDDDFPVRKYDKVLFHPKNAIPVDLESDNLLFVVPIEDVVAVFRRTKSAQSPAKRNRESLDAEDADDAGDDADLAT
ncbi:MAG: co-chaperone GroES [Planctomycetales bacterium]